MNGKKVDPETVEKFKALRRIGKSLPEISDLTGRPKTTILRYVSNIQVLPEFKEEWLAKRGASHSKMLEKRQRAFDEAKEQIKDLSAREKLLFLSSLYWCEGFKKDFGLTNSDPVLVKVFVQLLLDVLKIEKNRIRASIRIYEDMDKEACLSFWSKLLEIPKSDFLSVETKSGKKNGKLKYGMCRIRVLKGADYLKKMVATNKIVAEYLSL